MDPSHPETPLQRAQAAMVRIFPGRFCRELPAAAHSIGNEEKKMLFFPERAEIFVWDGEFWNIKVRILFPAEIRISAAGNRIIAEIPRRTEIFSFESDPVGGETYFRRRQIYRNVSDREESVSAVSGMTYFLEGPVADFACASYKAVVRGGCPGPYIYPDFEYPHMSEEANNQLFYACSGDMYAGAAWLDLSGKWLSRSGRDGQLLLTHEFHRRNAFRLAPGGEAECSFLIFAGNGREEHVGVLSDLLWRLNDEPMHVPQTDMRRFLDNYFSVWKRSELDGIRPGDHYAAHFFVGFYGQFPEGYYPPDQFGCSWLSYDLLKADYFCRLHDRTGNGAYLKKAEDLVNFYCRHHFIGNTHLTWPYHTGDFMKACPPYCKKSGWGAPLDAGYVDSLAQSEMIYDALLVYRRHPEFFPENWVAGIAEDVLRMQQGDGHFRRRYNDRLEPVTKAGWIDQNYESQSWIPALLLLADLGGGAACFDAAVCCGEAALFDLEIKGLFAMGGCETDYPTQWDVDGYRSMLRAMIDLYEATKEPRFLAGAEKVQALSSIMMCSYNVEIPSGTFYAGIGWKSKGMVATSFYGTPDYVRSFSTPSGNQSVCWVGYLLLQLYRITGKRIYADRGVAAVRQVMVYRDEASLEGRPYRENLLYTIFENNPQMSDPGGGYQAGVAQDGFSMFIDLYIYLDNILEEFGDVYCDTGRRELIGVNCFKVVSRDFDARRAVVENELAFERTFVLRCDDGRRLSFTAPARGTCPVAW